MSTKKKDIAMSLVVDEDLKIMINMITGIMDKKIIEIMPEIIRLGIREFVKLHPEVQKNLDIFTTQVFTKNENTKPTE